MALDVSDDDLVASLQAGRTAARDAQAAAVDTARARLSDGKSAVSTADWEGAIESFKAGLAVQGTHDEELTASLRAALDDAEAERDAAAAAAAAERQRIAAEEAEVEEQRRQQEEAEQARIAAEVRFLVSPVVCASRRH